MDVLPVSDRAALRAEILSHATDPADPDAHVFACVLAVRTVDGHPDLAQAVGLPSGDLAALIARYFPSLPYTPGSRQPTEPTLAETILEEEMADLRALLLENRATPGIATDWMAAVVARACLFRDHLWQDLGLTNRGELSALLLRHFRPLAERNTGDMKWKKFFYKQLCERSGLNLCKAPTCGVCTDRALCFGREE